MLLLAPPVSVPAAGGLGVRALAAVRPGTADHPHRAGAACTRRGAGRAAAGTLCAAPDRGLGAAAGAAGGDQPGAGDERGARWPAGRVRPPAALAAEPRAMVVVGERRRLGPDRRLLRRRIRCAAACSRTGPTAVPASSCARWGSWARRSGATCCAEPAGPRVSCGPRRHPPCHAVQHPSRPSLPARPFPGRPLVPGVVVLEQVMRAVEAAAGGPRWARCACRR